MIMDKTWFIWDKKNHDENCCLQKVQKVGLKIGEIHYWSVRKTYQVVFFAGFCWFGRNLNCQMSILAKNQVDFRFGACCVIEIF